MMRFTPLRLFLPLVLASVSIGMAEERSTLQRELQTIRPLIAKHCLKCHGSGPKVRGEVDLKVLQKGDDWIQQPKLLADVIDALDSEFMPPEDEAELAAPSRATLIAKLRTALDAALQANQGSVAAPLRRMNRFQYNNAVQDLFALNVEVFPLPERMMREHGGYFRPQTGKMPPKVRVGSRPLGKSQLIERRLAGVTPFPQDLRAEHGFDNQGDHLTLSPLLLESFLKLSRSVVESPDFNERTCGVWRQLFAPPANTANQEKVLRDRLGPFLTRAFRRPVEPSVLQRYVGHAARQLRDGASFPDAMKSVAAAAIASPRFLYLYDENDSTENDREDDYNLASRLSFFLWGSLPDQTLLDLAEQGKLNEPDELRRQVRRMLHDRRLKRFCDSFPSQWLQLERIISSTPDPQRYPQFYFAKYRASMHMMMEPLLLFETVLIEDHSLLTLIDADFSYRSNLLQTWYRDGSQGNAGSPVSIEFVRVPVKDRRQGGVITNAAVMTMTSNATRTQPITRGAWVAGVILNDPPEPPPADVPPLAEKPAADEADLTLRERFAAHRTRADCAGCHIKIDPLGFALENYDAAGIWREKYGNGRLVDPSGTLFGKRRFANIVEFKDVLLTEKDRFTQAFAEHMLAFALGRAVVVEDLPAVEEIVRRTADNDYRMQSLIEQIVLSGPFRGVRQPKPKAAP